jgi:indolepyruvate ferredoxin oxidoreductase
MVPVSEQALKQSMELNGVAVERNAMAFDIGRLMAAAPETLAVHLDAPARKAETLEALIARRAEFLTSYQDSRYAEAYQREIGAIRESLPDDLAEQAARSLFKLMAYKDEYEVARLMTSDSFTEELDAHFEPGYRLRYHMAPPLFSRARDSRGRPLKRAFGGWMTPVLRLLAAAKPVRGTIFDPFRWSHDRRLDRELLSWFLSVLAQARRDYDAKDHAVWMQALGAPMDIRGYGPVRDQAATEVRGRVSDLMQSLRPKPEHRAT